MDVWADKLARKLEDNSILLYMLAKYVDNINLVAQTILRGFFWQDVEGEVRLVWSQETLDVDNQEGKNDTLRTMELIRQVGNTLVPCLKLTIDLPEFHTDGKCPMQDIQVWKENTREGFWIVRHSFYQNPTMSPLVFHSGGAYTWRTKIVTLAKELRW